MNITVDEDKCCGAGQCTLVAPDIFDQREDDGVVVLLDAQPPQDKYAAAREAAAVCPGAAIAVTEGD